MTTTTTRPRRRRPDRPVRSATTATPANSTTTTKPASPASPAKPAKPAAAPKLAAGVAGRPARPAAPPRMPFVVLLVGLLGGALVSLLLLNTVLAQDAFTLTELQRSNQQLLQQRQALQEEIAKEESPARLGQRAKALGMREPRQPAFVDAQTGNVVGAKVRPVPYPAAAAAAAAGVVGVPGAIVPGDVGAGGTR
ncbi:MAG TPA: hypothetical protein VE465_07095 [Streptosporangiaceae bacterium]|jgi:hypothetical protein|nr:hypothetical protein [Streptosporangiaceae bacterium]